MLHCSHELCNKKIETRYTHGQWADVSCIPESGCCCLLVPLFLHFLSLQFSNIKTFRTLLSGTVRPRRLKLGTHVDSGWMYGVYQNQAAVAYLFLYFFFLQYSNIKVFVTFLRNCEAKKVETWCTHGQWVDVPCIPESGSCCCIFVPLFFHFSFSPIFKH